MSVLCVSERNMAVINEARKHDGWSFALKVSCQPINVVLLQFNRIWQWFHWFESQKKVFCCTETLHTGNEGQNSDKKKSIFGTNFRILRLKSEFSETKNGIQRKIKKSDFRKCGCRKHWFTRLLVYFKPDRDVVFCLSQRSFAADTHSDVTGSG